MINKHMTNILNLNIVQKLLYSTFLDKHMCFDV